MRSAASLVSVASASQGWCWYTCSYIEVLWNRRQLLHFFFFFFFPFAGIVKENRDIERNDGEAKGQSEMVSWWCGWLGGEVICGGEEGLLEGNHGDASHATEWSVFSPFPSHYSM